MKFELQTSGFKKTQADTILLGVFENGDLSDAFKQLTTEAEHYLKNFIKTGEFQGKTGQTLFLYTVPGYKKIRFLLVGCGKKSTLSGSSFRKIILASIKACASKPIHHILSSLGELPVEKVSFAWKIKQMVLLTEEALYTFDQFKSTKDSSFLLKKMTFSIASKDQKEANQVIKEITAIIKGIELTKNLANLPSNICTPSYLAEKAKKLAKEHTTLSVKILEESQMKKLGMGAFLAVAQGSAQDAKLIVLEYKGTKKKMSPIALVGKGVTFDTGGISLKSADGMVGMKYDMCGAATVLGTLKAAATLKLPLHLVGVIAATENMPSGSATKPEDIVTSLSGQTIEIMNTDAEGRLILSDALTYCERFNPEVVIDIATLTGAVVIALGYHASGLLSNNEALANDLLKAGSDIHDRAWLMPLWEEYQEQLKSPFADMSNVGGRTAGVITAACFLSRFTKKFRWAHLDVAGTAAIMAGGNERYATGRPVPLLMQYLINQCH